MNAADLERIRADAPMLQQKMKPRHLTMIAVGAPSEVLYLIRC
jgi:amino acid transporter